MSLSFTLVSAVQDILDPYLYPNGPWIHLATVMRSLPGGGSKEYVAFKKLYGRDVWVEEMQGHAAPFFSKQIENDEEWSDAVSFLQEAQLLGIGLDVEVRLGHRLAAYMEEHYKEGHEQHSLEEPV